MQDHSPGNRWNFDYSSLSRRQTPRQSVAPDAEPGEDDDPATGTQNLTLQPWNSDAQIELKEEELPVPSAKEVLYIELKRLGLVIQILRKPSIADIDRSGNISASEAVLLGVALSLDAFGAGIGAALIGFAPMLTSVVIALASGTFLATGLRIGYKYSDLSWIQRLSVFPGFVLIIMGIMKLM